LVQLLQEHVEKGLSFRIVRGPGGQEHTDAPHPFGLLSVRSERPRCGAADKGDELPALSFNNLINARVGLRGR
jgi:hypothetical protein